MLRMPEFVLVRSELLSAALVQCSRNELHALTAKAILAKDGLSAICRHHAT
jgi:hypothetical protein